MKKCGKILAMLFAAGMLFLQTGCEPEIKYVEKEVEKVVEKEVEKAVYVCPKCKKTYATAEEAANCCGVQTVEKEVIVYKFVCPKCNKSYGTAQEAADCCGVQIEYVEKEIEKIVKKYICPRDGKEYDTVEEAEACCGPLEVEKLVYITAVKEGIYTIHHYRHDELYGNNIYDYTEEKVEDKVFVVNNSTIEDLAQNTYEGYTAKALAQIESDIFIFYDYSNVTYTFQTGTEGKFQDETDTKEITGLYKHIISSLPAAVSSTHYFLGWFTSEGDELTAKFGLEDLTFTAKWVPKAGFVYNWYETPIDAETGLDATASSKYVYFGVFPKTYVSGATVNETETKIMGANTYYKGINDGQWYAKVTGAFDDDEPVHCSYEYYEMMEEPEEETEEEHEETIRYFKVEPIKWKVLTTNYNNSKKALLVAEKVLTGNVPYYVDCDDFRTLLVGEGASTTIYPCNYKYSTVRAYLNGAYESDDPQSKTYENNGFLQTAFTAAAQELIETTDVDNSFNSTGKNYFHYPDFLCENTKDKIFLLSVSELINSDYGFSSDVGDFGQGNARIRFSTDYAMANNAVSVDEDNGDGARWFTRTPSDGHQDAIITIEYDGDARYVRYCDSTDYGIVPALTISLQ